MNIFRKFSKSTLIAVRKQCYTSRSDYYKIKKVGNRAVVHYCAAGGIFLLGASYAIVPLYSIFCQTTGFNGTVNPSHSGEQVQKLEPIKNRVITVKFNADKGARLQWNFHPQQTEVRVYILQFQTDRKIG